jgi:tight adherence protein B
MNTLILSLLAGVAVTALIVGISSIFTPSEAHIAEERLDELAQGKRKAKNEPSIDSILKSQAITIDREGFWLSRWFSVESLNTLYEQADVGLPFRRFLSITAAIAATAAIMAWFLKLPIYAVPISAACLGALPFGWLILRKRKRIKKFTAQLPDALELVGRALRAGHGIASGLRVVAEEMPNPAAIEFGRVFEEQNLGIPLEEALRGLAERVPTMDVRFFVTAVIIQRTTGGDLAEILDKIGRLIRERFQILGQVQALTGEGRISGVVLLAMPPSLLALVYALNPNYISLLFTEELGRQMLMGTAVLQVLGALAIKKIVAIKV